MPDSQPLQAIEASIFPDTLDIALQPKPLGSPLERLRPLWHEPPMLPRMGITIASTDTRPRLVSLTVESNAEGWNPLWVKWTIPVRTVSELLGGDAVSAQDVLSDDDTHLQLLLLPGETREVTLELRTVLDQDTYARDYSFDMVVTDVNDGSRSAVTAMLRLRHPISDFESHLPAMYADEMNAMQAAATEDEPTPFFRRYLRGFDDASAPMRETLDNLHRFFDAFEAPPDFLPWLATWVGIVLDENWPEMKRRRLIREAVELYRWRGTRRGLSRYLEIYAGVRPEINDKPFRGMRLGPNTRLGVDLSDPSRLEQNTVLGDVPHHSFVVTIAVPDPNAVNEQTVRDIIEVQKPAHCAYVARIVRRAPDAGR
jgi:phage tail-like protein